jgi:hypothetical protein
MSEPVWMQLAIQIPVVLVFSVALGYIIKMFLAHIASSEERSKAFIKEQREANNKAVNDLAEVTRASMERLTDSLCSKVDILDDGIYRLRIESASHDAFVKTSFRERFGSAVADNAQRSADEEATHMALRIGQERKE